MKERRKQSGQKVSLASSAIISAIPTLINHYSCGAIGIGAKRAEITEEHILLEAKTVFFDAHTDALAGDDYHPYTPDPRRSTSLGPGIFLDPDEPYHNEHDLPSAAHGDSPFAARIERVERETLRSLDSRNPSTSGTHARRRSVDIHRILGLPFNHDQPSTTSVYPLPSRPSTGVRESLPAPYQHSPIPSPISSRRSSLVRPGRADTSGHTLEELRNVLINELEHHGDGPSRMYFFTVYIAPY